MKITLSKPDINISFTDFTIDASEPNKIIFGLSSIKNVGHTAVDNIIKERNEHGSFSNIIDFCSRVDSRVVNKKTIESLIFAGAFDTIEINRRKLYDNYEIILNRYGNKKLAAGQSSLFGGDKITALGGTDFAYNKQDWSEREKLSYEKSVLGVYLSSHPLAEYEKEVNKLSTIRFGDFEKNEEEIDNPVKLSSVRICGIISNLKLKQSKKGNRFAVFNLEDFTGQGECVVFPKIFETYKNIIQNDNIVIITGRPEENGTGIKLIIDEIKPLVKFERSDKKDNGKNNHGNKIIIKIESSNFNPDKIYEIKQLLQEPVGNCKVYFDIFGNDGIHSLMEIENLSILLNEEIKQKLEVIFGLNNIKIN